MSEIANTWQMEMQNAITSSEQLLSLLDLKHESLQQSKFPCKVPMSFINRMQKNNPSDPLLLQVLPQVAELEKHIGYKLDPLSEEERSPIPGLIHKYHGRALLTITGACAVHCRYCFRQNTDYNNNHPGRNIQQILLYLRDNSDISEIILSGGDPLSLSDNKLAFWIDKLSEIESITRLRIHTRLPVVIPQRITNELINILKTSRFWTTIVFHINHPNELDKTTRELWDPLISAKIMLWNQSVLLKNINDNPIILKKLSEKLLDHNIIPYYLHKLDKVYGSKHFYINNSIACDILNKMRDICPGYYIPKLVADLGGRSKTAIY